VGKEGRLSSAKREKERKLAPHGRGFSHPRHYQGEEKNSPSRLGGREELPEEKSGAWEKSKGRGVGKASWINWGISCRGTEVTGNHSFALRAGPDRNEGIGGGMGS